MNFRAFNPTFRAEFKSCKTLISCSANLSGFPPSLTLRHLKSYFGDKIDLIIDAGELAPSTGSTVIDVTEEKLTLIREGMIKGDVLFPYFEEEAGLHEAL